MKIKLTFWKLVFLALMAAGFYGTVVRFTHGLGRSTNLNDQFPWGLWIGFDVLCGGLTHGCFPSWGSPSCGADGSAMFGWIFAK